MSETGPPAPDASPLIGSAERAHQLKPPTSGAIVLDTSFIIALLQRHPGATALADVLPRGVMTTVTAGEVFYTIAATGGAEPDRVEAVLRAQGVRIVDLPLAAAHHFPRLQRIDAACRAEQEALGEKGDALSLSELCVLGYASALQIPALTGDRHWTALLRHGLEVPVYLYQDLKQAGPCTQLQSERH